MIVVRTTWKPKPGCLEELVDLAKGTADEMGKTYRVYTTITGTLRRVVGELEFDSLAEQEEFMTKWREKPGRDALLQKWRELIENETEEQLLTLR